MASSSGWQQTKKRGNRDVDGDLSNPSTSKQPTIDHYWAAPKPAETKNRFTPIAPPNNEPEKMDTNAAPEGAKKDVTEPKPSPFIVHGVEDIKPLKELLLKVAGEKYSFKCLTNGDIKIQVLTCDAYGKVLEGLLKMGIDLHTYQFKRERAFRVILKGMHATTKTDDIKSELEKLGHSVQDINNVRQRATKVPLPLFYVNLERKANNGDIYKISKILNYVVEFQPPRARREIPQCTRCQHFGHTQAYCGRTPRCVKCCEHHATKDCPRNVKDAEVKCTNCGGAHPANYRGCEAHKKLQQRFFPKLREKILSRTTGQSDNQNQNNPAGNQTNPGASYASVVRGNTQEGNPPNNLSTVQPSNDMSELKEMMKELMKQMSTMLNLLTVFVSKQN